MFVLLQYKFQSISASTVTASYSDFCNMRTDTICTASGTVTCLSCVPLLSVIAKKTTLRFSDHFPDVSITSNVATQFTSLPTVQVTFFPTNCSTLFTVESFPHSCYLYFGVSDLIEFNMKSLLSLISSTDRCILKYQVFPASRNSNDISVYNWPHKGTCLPF